MMCENFVSLCQKAIEEDDAVESIRIADELRTRAEELKEIPIPELSKLPRNYIQSVKSSMSPQIYKISLAIFKVCVQLFYLCIRITYGIKPNSYRK